jgi:hypothetical protein
LVSLAWTLPWFAVGLFISLFSKPEIINQEALVQERSATE